MECLGFTGLLFGHDFTPRYSTVHKSSGIDSANPQGQFFINYNGPAPTLEDSRTYHGDICRRCGQYLNQLNP